ncbi:MAG: hypothetical protein WCH74_01370 [Chloroflexota bacterium]
MAKYLLAFHGGSMPDDPAEQAAALEAWGAWYTSIGAGLIDPGSPVAFARSVASDGSVSDGGGADPVSGYTLIEAADIDAAVEIASRNPLLGGGGHIEVAETFTMG